MVAIIQLIRDGDRLDIVHDSSGVFDNAAGVGGIIW